MTRPTRLPATVSDPTARPLRNQTLGKHLLRVARSLRIECALHFKHGLQIRFGKLPIHEIALVESDAVFATQAAAHRHTGFGDFGAGGQHALRLLEILLIVEQDGMEISVARMKDIGDRDSVFARNRIDTG